MQAIRLAKIVGATLLLVSLCLPMSSCVDDPPGTDTSAAASLGSEPQTRTYHYVWRPANWAYPASYVFLFGFVWPAGAMLLSPRTRARWVRTCFWLAEPILLAGTIYLWRMIAFFGDPEIGAFVAASGIVVYALAWLVETAGRVRLRTAHDTREGSLFGAHPGSVRVGHEIDLTAPIFDDKTDAGTGREVRR